ncbi:MAG: universal stress protein [Chloroflexota bacterium]|nr:universal stress protein [Chloroflexota bacterium]
MYTRLLVPLDGSHLAESVLPLVEKLASAWGATVLLLHVSEKGAPAAVHGDRHLSTVDDATPYLEELAARLRAEGISVQTHAHPAPEGDVARSIAAHSAEEGVDLVILCTHGRGTVRGLLFGRIAQQTVRRGSIPVLLVRPDDAGATPPFEPDKILVPLDGTSGAEAALQPAALFAQTFSATLHLVMVVPTQETVRGDRQAVTALLPAATRATLDLAQEDAQTYLSALAEQVESVPVSIEVRRGDVPAALVDEAAEPGVGLIVIATHGRAGLQAIWAGSVTAQILARVHAPILLLRMIVE